jgi:hypothetical protein
MNTIPIAKDLLKLQEFWKNHCMEDIYTLNYVFQFLHERVHVKPEVQAVKKSSVSEWHNRFKESSHVEITDEDNAHHFLRYEGCYSLWIHSMRPKSQRNLLCGNNEAVKLCLEKGLNFGPTIWFSTIRMLQLTRNSLSSNFWRKKITEMGHST